jgi:hypothetical protein
MEWLATADNVNITNTGAVEKREGYALDRAGTFTGIYTTLDFQRMYLVDGGTIQTYSGAILIGGLSSAPMFWTEVNDQVFYNNGIDSGIILADNTVIPWSWPTPDTPALSAGSPWPGQVTVGGLYQVCCTFILPDGRETGASDVSEITLAEGESLLLSGLSQRAGYRTNIYAAPANSTVFQLLAFTGFSAFSVAINPDNLGRELQTAFMDPLPATADVVQEWKGRIYAAQYMPSVNQTVVWFSEPLAFHLFNLNSNFLLFPGRVHMLAPTDDALIISTDSKIYAYDGKNQKQIADYGVIPGQHWSKDDNRIVFWTTRGVCAALPFSNLTERQVSVAPGVRAGGAIVRTGGQKRYVVALQQGGSAFNDF